MSTLLQKRVLIASKKGVMFGVKRAGGRPCLCIWRRVPINGPAKQSIPFSVRQAIVRIINKRYPLASFHLFVSWWFHGRIGRRTIQRWPLQRIAKAPGGIRGLSVGIMKQDGSGVLAEQLPRCTREWSMAGRCVMVALLCCRATGHLSCFGLIGAS